MQQSQIQVKSGKSEETIKNPAMGIAAGKKTLRRKVNVLLISAVLPRSVLYPCLVN